MKYKIGVFGSAEDIDSSVLKKAKELGKILGNNNVIVITGATSGLPYFISKQAHTYGAKIWGFAAEKDAQSMKKSQPDHDLSMYSRLIYIPKNFPFASDLQVCRKYRNVISTANCDAGIIISGRWGSMNEFTNLHDYGKVIGILTKTGGIADELPDLYTKIKKKSKAKVLFNDSPKQLVEKIIEELKSHTV